MEQTNVILKSVSMKCTAPNCVYYEVGLSTSPVRTVVGSNPTHVACGVLSFVSLQHIVYIGKVVTVAVG